MLQILVQNRQVDIFEDTEVSVTSENPLFSSDHIPVPYSADIELPLTSRNRQIFGFVDRHARTEIFETLPARIMFGGLEITCGEVKVSEVYETITISYNGVLIPKNIDKMAFRQNLGKLDFGKAIFDSAGMDRGPARSNYNNYFTGKANEPYPDIVAAPVGIEARESYERQEGRPGTDVSASGWINGFDQSNGNYWPNQYRPKSYINKVLPALRVGWLLERLLGGRVENNIFNVGEWRRLMMLSTWHPKYNPAGKSPVYDIDGDLDVSITLADFMAEKAANEIVVELLKLPCASIFAKGDLFFIECNKDVLARETVHDWSDKIVGRLTISEQELQRYVCGYNQEDEQLSEALITTPVSGPGHIASLNPSVDVVPGTFKVASTGQIIERVGADDSSNVDFKVVHQGMTQKVELDPDDTRSEYAMSFGGTVLKTNFSLQITTSDPAQGHRWYYCPQLTEVQKERPDSLIIALYYGMQREIRWAAKSFYYYPYLSHCNFDAWGRRLGDLSLSFLSDDGPASYHRDFKAWVEKPKRTIRCKVKLTALDLHELDLRDKVLLRNRRYYILSITMTLRKSTIEPAEVDLVDA